LFDFSGAAMMANLRIAIDEFIRIYTPGPVLGKGGYGAIFAGHRNRDKLQVAIKILSELQTPMVKVKHHNNSNNIYGVEEEPVYIKIPVEVDLMQKTNHIPGVIKLIEYFELPGCFLLVIERVGSSASDCKDLFDHISFNGPLNEGLAKYIFKQIVDTVDSCHQAGVLHRDNKDENILFDETNKQIKLIDFGSGDKYHQEMYTDFNGM
jgi:serine/threonine protein kinase